MKAEAVVLDMRGVDERESAQMLAIFLDYGEESGGVTFFEQAKFDAGAERGSKHNAILV